MSKSKNKGKNSQKEEEEAQEEVWREVFTMFDKDKNGQISRQELGMVLRALDMDPTQKELDEALRQLDKDGNGIIEYSDFRTYMMKLKKSTYEERKSEMLRAFQLMDKNNDKFIDSTELMTVLRSLGEPLTEDEVNAMIRVADVNKDGKIDYEEFVNFILSPCLQPSSRQPSRQSSRDLGSKHSSLQSNQQPSATMNPQTSTGFFYTADSSRNMPNLSQRSPSMNNYLPSQSQESLGISDMNANFNANDQDVMDAS